MFDRRVDVSSPWNASFGIHLVSEDSVPIDPVDDSVVHIGELQRFERAVEGRVNWGGVSLRCLRWLDPWRAESVRTKHFSFVQDENVDTGGVGLTEPQYYFLRGAVAELVETDARLVIWPWSDDSAVLYILTRADEIAWERNISVSQFFELGVENTQILLPAGHRIVRWLSPRESDLVRNRLSRALTR